MPRETCRSPASRREGGRLVEVEGGEATAPVSAASNAAADSVSVSVSIAPADADADLASVRARLLAALFDFAVLWVAGCLGWLIGRVLLDEDSLASLLKWAFFLYALVPQWALIAHRGQSLGKLLLRIRIVKNNDCAVGFLHGVVLRSWITGWVWLFVYGALFVDAVYLLRRDRRTLHDRLAGTKVVKA